ncbi:MAG: long-chain fatty acid--CoA ligase [Candidatus Abyssobacteria bacterium SURF_5]|uniref:Long-chain fatty acid--CoA ligase n=1 Tax=Abyssobacteria bacterium (strain SURF_5) TaxID=2093360 RepID=A0A3A4N7I2_ABYX5|nr:MAG: long-chain fatty acid--CoA ligase [Candidatus Abyssubacteria bacterium SURF_5]
MSTQPQQAPASPPAPFTLAWYAQEMPNKQAVSDGGRHYTFLQFYLFVNRLANVLGSLGIGRGDRVGVLMHNSIEAMAMPYAVGKLKANAVPIGYRLKSKEVEYILNNSQAKALLMGKEFDDVVRPILNNLENVTPERVLVSGGNLPWCKRLEALTASAPETDLEADPEESSSSIIYTSGTTGLPKGAFRENRPRDLQLIMSIISNFRITSDDHHVVTCPLYHSAPPVFAGLHVILGGSVHIMPKFDPERFLQVVEREKITSTFMVPTMLNMVATLPAEVKKKYDVSSMRNIVVGGAPFHISTKRAIIEYFGEGRLFEFYGSTETGINTILRPEEQLKKPGSCGVAFDGNEILLLDDDRKQVSQGAVGEMFMKNNMLVDGYFRNKRATEESFHDGYLSVGDMAYMDEEGYYYIVDRKKDMVISGGVNIYPAEIEIALNHHPKVFDCAIIGVPDEQWGESLKAFVVLKPGCTATPDEMIEFCRQNLAPYKKPKWVEFVPDLPRNPSGKVMKKSLREQYRTPAPDGRPS